MTKLKQYILHFILVASFLAVVSCTDEQSVLPVAEGTPLTVTAESVRRILRPHGRWR